jgi:acid phosphatase (class A)
MIRRLSRVVSLLLVGLAASSAAPLPAAAPTAAPAPAWPLPPLDYFIHKLPPPPQPGSWRDRMDLSDLVARQQMVTQADLKSIARTYWFTIFTFSDALGPQFTAENYPQTAALFARVIATANFVTSGLKDHYQRPRPFEAHPDQVQLLVRNEPGYSYPSGHTTRGRLCALVLAEFDPSQRGLIVPAAERVGIDRIMAGEHYQTDIAAGRRLAKILFQILCKNQQFQAELATVKAAEWTTPPSPLPTPKDPVNPFRDP